MIATRTEARGRETMDEITAAGGTVALHTADLRSRSAVRETIQATLAQYGRLDILVHNAGVVARMPIGQIDDRKLDELFDLNIKSVIWFTEEALPALEASKPSSMLFVSSITGNLQFQHGFGAYGASKAGVSAFVKAAACELGPRGIRVNGVQPGFVAMTETAGGLTPEIMEQIAQRLPLRSIPRPDDVAQALVFLASDEASHITGHLLTIDAGLNLAPAT